MDELALCKLSELTNAYARCSFNTSTALIRGLLTIDPAQRMTLADVYQHPWCIRSTFLCFSWCTFFSDAELFLDLVNLRTRAYKPWPTSSPNRCGRPEISAMRHPPRLAVRTYPTFFSFLFCSNTARLLIRCKCSEMNTDDDGDDIMLSATNQSQFTQSLLLFVRSFFSPLSSFLLTTPFHRTSKSKQSSPKPNPDDDTPPT